MNEAFLAQFIPQGGALLYFLYSIELLPKRRLKWNNVGQRPTLAQKTTTTE